MWQKIFDSHFHIINNNFPLVSNSGFVPAEFKISDYKNATKGLNIVGGVIVSGSFQGFDQKYLINSLEMLGDNFTGVTQLPLDVKDSDIARLNTQNIKGIRFNIKRLDPINKLDIEYFAKRIFDLVGWHSEFYIESSMLDEFYSTIINLPAVSIDHLGLTKKGFQTLLKFIEKGVKVKATGFGRIDFDPVEGMKKIVDVNPDSLMFGTDLPSTRTIRPFRLNDAKLIEENFSTEIQKKIFYENALEFYRMK